MSDTPTMNSKAALKLISEIEARTEKLKAMFEPVPANAGAGKSDSETTGPVRKTRTKKTSSADEAPKTAPRISRIAGKDAEALYTGFDKDDKKGRTAHREAFNKYVESLSNDVFMAKDSQRALIDEFNKTITVTAAEPVTDGHESAASEAE
jgi:hypothetical protein